VINLPKTGRVEMVIGQGRGAGLSARPSSKTALKKKTWTHVAFVVERNAKQASCYLNGKLDKTTAIPDKLTATLDVEGKDLRIPAGHQPFSGSIDELKIHHRAVTADEIKAAYEKEKAGRE
jgi:hypothetical protein